MAACVGNAVEWYDFAIYGAMAGTLGVVFFPSTDPTGALLAAFGLYGSAFLVRPVGAVLLGGLGDRWGRRRVLLLAVVLMTASTAGLGLLPTYAALGLVAPMLAVALRSVQGLATGGETGVLGAYLVESAREGARARQASGLLATSGLGIALGMVVTGGLVALVGADGLQAGWWRVPFLLALPLGVAGLFMRRSLLETLVAHPPVPTSPPHQQPPTRPDKGKVMRGFTLIAAGSLAFNVFFIFMPAYLITLGQRPGQVLVITAVMLVFTAGSALLLGVISDRCGRRPVALGSTIVLVVGTPTLMWVAHGSLLGLVVAQTVVGMAASGALNPVTPAELFSSRDRARGLGLTAGLATALVGGTGPLFATMLIRLSDSTAVVGGYVSLMSLGALVALRGWPETAFSAFDSDAVRPAVMITHEG